MVLGRMAAWFNTVPIKLITGLATVAALGLALFAVYREGRHIAAAQLPGARSRRDQWGNIVLKLPDGAVTPETYIADFVEGVPVYGTRDIPAAGKEVYPNRPGFSPRDVANGVVGAIPGAAGLIVQAAATGATRNPVKGLAAGGVTEAGASLLLDELARSVGSRQPVGLQAAADAGSSRLHPSVKDLWDFFTKR